MICQAMNKVESLLLWADPAVREMANGMNV